MLTTDKREEGRTPARSTMSRTDCACMKKTINFVSTMLKIGLEKCQQRMLSLEGDSAKGQGVSGPRGISTQPPHSLQTRNT